MNGLPDFHTVRGYQILEQSRKLLTSAMEDYLEMIYRHSLTESYMRISMLAELLNVRPPSATSMVQKLDTLGMLKYKKYDLIFLTDKGVELGKFLLERHTVIETFLKNLGVTENVLTDTERMEHIVSDESLQKFVLFNRFVKNNPDIVAKIFDDASNNTS
jgi:Mn-dependent DtxR family transcriptional regulator